MELKKERRVVKLHGTTRAGFYDRCCIATLMGFIWQHYRNVAHDDLLFKAYTLKTVVLAAQILLLHIENDPQSIFTVLFLKTCLPRHAIRYIL
jgi:hypothetical protein